MSNVLICGEQFLEDHAILHCMNDATIYDIFNGRWYTNRFQQCGVNENPAFLKVGKQFLPVNPRTAAEFYLFLYYVFLFYEQPRLGAYLGQFDLFKNQDQSTLFRPTTPYPPNELTPGAAIAAIVGGRPLQAPFDHLLKKLCAKSATPKYPIYTAGYTGWKHSRLITAVEQLNALLMDIRFVPFSSSDKRWNNDALMEMVGIDNYLHVRAMGNIFYNERNHGIQLFAPHLAVELVRQQLQKRPVILLCTCSKVERCHRLVAATFLSETIGESIDVVHLHPSTVPQVINLSLLT